MPSGDIDSDPPFARPIARLRSAYAATRRHPVVRIPLVVSCLLAIASFPRFRKWIIDWEPRARSVILPRLSRAVCKLAETGARCNVKCDAETLLITRGCIHGSLFADRLCSAGYIGKHRIRVE